MQQKAMNHLINTKTVNDEMGLCKIIVHTIGCVVTLDNNVAARALHTPDFFLGGGWVGILDLNLVAKVCTQILTKPGGEALPEIARACHA